MKSKYLVILVTALLVIAASGFAINYAVRERARHVEELRHAAERAEQEAAAEQKRQVEEATAQAEEQRKALAEAQEAEREQAAFAGLREDISKEAATEVVHGRRLKVARFMAGMDFLQRLLSSVPKPEYVDLVSMYKTIEGYDGSTSSEALASCRAHFIGKYYVLQGDVFQIQADRDYPLEGLNEFSIFGWVNLPPRIPVNVVAASDEKMPPYTIAAMLSKIVDFQLGTNRAGQQIVMPVVEIVVAASGSQFADDPGEVIINEPLLVAQLLKTNPAEQETVQ